jgi:glycosyltransferase involved in cell wall biosynthesis
MRILQVVTLISPDGAYGGPTTVALNQCEALYSLGHNAHVAAGYPGAKAAERLHGAVPLHLFPARTLIPGIGFAGLSAPGLLRWLARECDGYDVVHVHVARDFVTLPAARLGQLRGRPVVVQPHGMIDVSDRPLSRPLDAVLTRPTLRSAAAVCHLTSREHDDLVQVAGEGLRLVQLHNGVPLPTTVGAAEDEVLFLARLHPRKRPLNFLRAAMNLHPKHPSTSFAVVGPDEGEGRTVSAAVAEAGTVKIRWEGPLQPDEARQRLAHAAVYVLPSVDEPFPMSVLEAMARGVPVIITDTCGLAEAVTDSGAGIVVRDDVDELTKAIDYLLSDRDLRASIGSRARSLARETFGMEPVAERLEAIYLSALTGDPAPPNNYPDPSAKQQDRGGG